MALALGGLGQRLIDATYERGLTMTIDDAMAFAVEERLPPRPVTIKTRTQSSLTKRELEIARLMAASPNVLLVAVRCPLAAT